MKSVTERARELRAEAVDVVNRHQKLASLQLYRVLAGCLEVAEMCAASIAAERELRALVASEASPGRSRGYVERGSDEYILACRFVLQGESHANLSRYSNALREAKKLQVHSSQLYEWLKNKGGINALFLLRPSVHKVINAKLIRFDRSVTLPKSGQFTLTLERRPDGVFTVIEEPDGRS